MRPDMDQIDPYFHMFLRGVPEADAVSALTVSAAEMASAVASMSEDLVTHRYEPGKWSVGEVLQHIADCERVFQYRALRYARGDTAELSGFDHDAWAPIGAAGRTIADIGEELQAVRTSSVALFKSMTPERAARGGVGNGKQITVTGLAYLAAGHSRHHLNVIQTKYL